MHILIVGAGRIGRAFEHVIAKSGAQIALYDADVSKIPNQLPLSESAQHADIILLCIQSFAVRETVLELAKFIKPGALIVTVAKGIERGAQKTIDTVLRETVPQENFWGVIIGPMLAEEILHDQGSAGVFVGNDKEQFTRLQKIISSRDISLEYSDDIRGVVLAGVLKNIYALGLGIADGLGWGANRKGWLITHIIKEMRSILEVLGGDPNTADGPAGLGDLIATGSSPHSRNRSTGQALVSGSDIDPLSEGFISMESLSNLLGPSATDFPIFTCMHDIIIKKMDPRERFTKLI